MKHFFRSNYQHILAVILFIVIVLVYFSPQFDGQSIDQSDVTQYIGSSNESYWFKNKTGQEQLWSNSMFGGMPTTQTTLIHPGNFIGRAIMNFINWFPAPGGMVLLHLIGFYIMLMCFRVNKWVAIIGAIAFAFASYEIVILDAGHNSKSLAVAFLPPVIGGFYLAYRHKLWLGLGLSALFMTLEMSCNHLQVTYYLVILLIGLGIGELFRTFKNNQYKNFSITSGGLILVYLLAAAVNYGNIAMTNNYAKSTIRGGNDLLLTPSGEKSAKGTEGGLDKDYITNWSYGIGESFTILSPYVKGGGTTIFSETVHADIVDKMEFSSAERKQVLGYPVYWGEQPFTSGPVYIGVIMVFLAFIGMFFLKDPIKWPLFIVGVLVLMLSWGKNYMGFTEFWLDNIPGYNKFRTVTIILVILELIIPLIAVLFLDYLIKNREEIILQKNKFLYTSSGFILFLLVVKFIGLGDNYTSQSFDIAQLDKIENQITSQIANEDPNKLMTQVGLDVRNKAQVEKFIDDQMIPYENTLDNVRLTRAEVYHSSMNRSILFSLLAFGALALLIFSSVNVFIPIALLGVLVTIDMMGVSANYLNNDEEFWIDANEKKYPFSPTAIDLQILDLEIKENPNLETLIAKSYNKVKTELTESDYSSTVKNRIKNKEKFAVLNHNTNYRVFDYSGGFTSSKASYYHKSLGGYHGAKLKTIQNIYEFHLSNSNNAVYDMLNVKYFIQPTSQGLTLRKNSTAIGNSWFIKDLSIVDTRDTEISSLGKEFEIENSGSGTLLVNSEPLTITKIRGFESVKYIMGIDTLDVPLSNGIQKGMKAAFVMDANGVTNLVPEYTLEIDTANSFTRMVTMEVVSEFLPAERAYISKENVNELKAFEYSGQGSVDMTSYSPMLMKYESNSEEHQFAIFSEMYYDNNWKAFIDGQETHIYNVDYCLRGLEVPKGKHKIEFIYDSTSYDKSNTISFALCCLVLAFTGFSVWKNRKETIDIDEPNSDKAE